MNWNSQCIKYRVSEGKNKKTSNSTDASVFHRDINVMDNTNTIPPIYTLVIYLDHATLELIPGSYKQFSFELLEKSIDIPFNPGDAVIFNALTLHRGKFEKKHYDSRKCIQIFEIFRNRNEFNQYNPKILTIPATDSSHRSYFSQRFYTIPFLKEYILYKTQQLYVMKKSSYLNYSYFSPDAERKRTYKDIDKGNLYRIINTVYDTKKPNQVYQKLLTYPFIKIILMDMLIVFLILYILFYNKK